ncbi:MAG: transglycosylase family protein, partial [Microthrixaceae bacterium]
DPDDPATWERMAQCEANGDWAANTGNGYYGGLQFSLTTWESYGGSGYPHESSKARQIEIGKRLQAAEGWQAWPRCASALGYS